MNAYPANPPAEPFFLDTAPGKRFCLFYAPVADAGCRGAFVYVHPFAEEMNKARRMAALQARAFAAIGFAVLQVDLYGCGDSSGEFGDARWEIWKEDLSAAKKWLEKRLASLGAKQQLTCPIGMWGLRLGALLALDFARDTYSGIDNLILWQPVLRGELFMTQFLRLRIANEMLDGRVDPRNGTQALRNALAAEEVLEIGGYDLAPALAAWIDRLDVNEWTLPKAHVNWFEIVSESGRSLSPAVERVAGVWAQRGVDLHVRSVQGLPFWATQEVSECPELLAATLQVFTEVRQ